MISIAWVLLAFLIGVLIGCVIMYVMHNKLNKEKSLDKLKNQFDKFQSDITNQITMQFNSSLESNLQTNINRLLEIDKQILEKHSKSSEKELNHKKELIDKNVNVVGNKINDSLIKIKDLMGALEKDRQIKFSALTEQLKNSNQETRVLANTTRKLEEILANTKVRGQWGERMAEDILNMIGFIEGIQYKKQSYQDSGINRPDFTFNLPNGLIVNMDVKFPLNNYLSYINEKDEINQLKYKKKFLSDVKNRIDEVNSRDYINPKNNTLDYVIIFIPNEQICNFIHENDQSIIDQALKKKVIICSPMNLYAILSIIRQSIENFHLQKTNDEMRDLFNQFEKQWQEFIKSFEKMGKKIEESQNEFNNLTSTRKKKLEKPLMQITNLKQQGKIDSYDKGKIKTARLNFN